MSDVFHRIARNPMTSEAVNLLAKVVPHFKPGKEMRDRINAARTNAASRNDYPKAPASVWPVLAQGHFLR